MIGPPGIGCGHHGGRPAGHRSGARVRVLPAPSRGLTVIAVTGTNGKSSITHRLGGVLRGAGRTGGYDPAPNDIALDGTPVDIDRRPTTPESVDLQRLLRWFARQPCHPRGVGSLLHRIGRAAAGRHRCGRRVFHQSDPRPFRCTRLDGGARGGDSICLTYPAPQSPMPTIRLGFAFSDAGTLARTPFMRTPT